MASETANGDLLLFLEKANLMIYKDALLEQGLLFMVPHTPQYSTGASKSSYNKVFYPFPHCTNIALFKFLHYPRGDFMVPIQVLYANGKNVDNWVLTHVN